MRSRAVPSVPGPALPAARAFVRAQTLREYGALRALRHKAVATRFYAGARGFTDVEYATIWA